MSTIRSAIRKINQLSHAFPSQINNDEGQMELDTHADTGCASNHVRIIEFTGKSCTVSGFSTQLPSMPDIPIINGAVAYDHPDSGEVFIIQLNQFLYLGDKVEHTLIFPNQC